MKKRFGQNFLVNRGAREKLTGILPVEKGSRVWEIGPGIGAMTWHLLEKGADITVFEIDHGFIESLKDFYGDLPNFSIVEGDFLKSFKDPEKTAVVPDYILGNLPYVSGSVMIANIVRSGRLPRKMVFTVQKEVGRRMAAKPGSSDYSSFSLVCQSRCDVVLKGELKSGSFYPRPAVQSIIVEMNPHDRFDPAIEDIYYNLIDDLFLARRKKISNNLTRGKIAADFGKEPVLSALDESGISGGVRAETLAVGDIEKLSRILLKNQK